MPARDEVVRPSRAPATRAADEFIGLKRRHPAPLPIGGKSVDVHIQVPLDRVSSGSSPNSEHTRSNVTGIDEAPRRLHVYAPLVIVDRGRRAPLEMHQVMGEHTRLIASMLSPAVPAGLAWRRGSRLALVSMGILVVQVGAWFAYYATEGFSNSGMAGVWAHFIIPTMISLVVAAGAAGRR